MNNMENEQWSADQFASIFLINAFLSVCVKYSKSIKKVPNKCTEPQ